MGRPSCVVVLSLAVPPDWFWCGQPPLRPIPIHSSRHFKCAPAQSQRPCLTPLFPSFELPCSHASFHALSFCGDAFFLCQSSGQGGSHLPSRCGVPTTCLTVALLHLRPDLPHARAPTPSHFAAGAISVPPASLMLVVPWQSCSFSFVCVNVRRFDIPRVGWCP